MAKQSIIQLFEAVSDDETLRDKLKAAVDPESFVKIAEEYGYNFTTKELQVAVEEFQTGVLSDEVKKSVAESLL